MARSKLKSQALEAGNIKASAYMNADQNNITTDTDVKVQFNAENFDPNGDYDHVTNYRYTAPITGYYLLNARIQWTTASVIADKRYWIRLYKNGGLYKESTKHASLATLLANEITQLAYLVAGDYIEVYARQGSGVNTPDIFAGSSTFDVHLLST